MSNVSTPVATKPSHHVIRAYNHIVSGSSFSQRLERELRVDSSSSSNEKVANPGGLREKRDEIHRTAIQSLPYGWVRK
jgi:hypothetical protein